LKIPFVFIFPAKKQQKKTQNKYQPASSELNNFFQWLDEVNFFPCSVARDFVVGRRGFVVAAVSHWDYSSFNWSFCLALVISIAKV
jgi:hypothetical protein